MENAVERRIAKRLNDEVALQLQDLLQPIVHRPLGAEFRPLSTAMPARSASVERNRRSSSVISSRSAAWTDRIIGLPSSSETPSGEQHHGPEALDLRVYPIVDVLPVHQGIRNDQWSPRIEDLDRRAEIELPNLMKIFIGDEVVELRHLNRAARVAIDRHDGAGLPWGVATDGKGNSIEYVLRVAAGIYDPCNVAEIAEQARGMGKFVHTRSLLAPLAQANPNDWELPSPPCAQTGGGNAFRANANLA